jgi:hypothetical protein
MLALEEDLGAGTGIHAPRGGDRGVMGDPADALCGALDVAECGQSHHSNVKNETLGGSNAPRHHHGRALEGVEIGLATKLK